MIQTVIAQWAAVESVNTFLENAATRFNTPRKAITILRSQLRRPPSDVDISNPSDEVYTALQALGCLACYVTPAHPLAIRTRNHRDASQTASSIESNWSSCVGLWVLFFIDKFLLAETEPSTQYGQELLDVIAYMIPLLFMYPALCSDNVQAVEQLKSISHEFPNIATRAMLMLVEKYHFTWNSWCSSVGSVQLYGISGSESFTAAMLEAAFTYGHNVSLIYVRHIHRECQRAHTTSEIMDFAGMRCLMLSFTTCIHPDSPLYIPFILNGGVRKLTDLLTTVIRRRKSIRHIQSTTSSNFEDPYVVAALAASQLGMTFSRSPRSVCDALEGGLISAIFKANRFYDYEKFGSYLSNSHHGEMLSESFKNILERIAMFLVYPSVLHRFLNAAEKMTREGLEEALAVKSQPLFKTWRGYVEIAHDAHRVYRRMKTKGTSRCGYGKCPMHVKGQLGRNPEVIRYFRCTACKSITYCSRECAKNCWKESHKEQCQRLIEDSKTERGHPAHVDTIFHNELRRTFIRRHKEQIYGALTRFFQQNTSGFWEIIGIPRAVIVLDFCRPAFLSIEAMSVMNLEQLLKDKRLQNFSERVDFLRKVDKAALRENKVIVMTFVPTVGSGYGEDTSWPGSVDVIPASSSLTSNADDDSEYSDSHLSDFEGSEERATNERTMQTEEVD
ncbi:hypothetical protein Moror_7844 [Moniliophthora roreri MCA 2997]|uniref:MYND-type domain-containing protein n=2 Tax=Moniliophthora roreri TaxID=221103 RepID=V2XC92_MONRO|nr:hypothetical protein Moror_7844 [Moniliophthora roreri MCA 2997]